MYWKSSRSNQQLNTHTHLLFLAKIGIFFNSFFFLLALLPLRLLTFTLLLVQYVWHFHIQYLIHTHTHTQKGRRWKEESMKVIYLCSLSAWLISIFTFLRLKCHFLKGDFPIYHHPKGRTDHSSKCLQSTVYLILPWACVRGKSLQLCPTLCDPMNCNPPGSSDHGDSPGKNTGVGCHALLQGIFLPQESNQGLLHCRWILYQLSYQGSPDSVMVSDNSVTAHIFIY